MENNGVFLGGNNICFTFENTASLDEKTTLDDIYCRFNIDRPSDFFGHSLSVSDVVVLHRKGKTDSYFVDNIGFQPVTDFFKKEPKDVAV